MSKLESFPDQDRCVECQIGTYSLIEATDTNISCNPCPIGGYCAGGSSVEAVNGYWRREDNISATIFKCSPGKSLILLLLLLMNHMIILL